MHGTTIILLDFSTSSYSILVAKIVDANELLILSDSNTNQETKIHLNLFPKIAQSKSWTLYNVVMEYIN